ncbi:hypothetical protein F5146DRAFT_490390 [Armillaria mellea]|nr:hypothetical protein F5146DRAFT_490390 [Armillaria mellea]
MVVLAKDAHGSDTSFVVLLLAMAIFTESGFMNNLLQVSAPSSIPESQVEGVRLRRFRRRWLCILSLARGARYVVVVGLPFMTSIMDRSHRTYKTQDFDTCFRIVWAEPRPLFPIKMSDPQSQHVPLRFIANLCEAQPSLVGKIFGWKDMLIAGAWGPL